MTKNFTPRHEGHKGILFLNYLGALCALVPLCGALLLSCQSVPQAPDFSLEQYLPLEPGGYVYLIAEQDALPVLNQFMLNNIDNKQFQQMVDQTSLAAAAVYMTPQLQYRLIAWGSYPASRAKMAFGSSKEWKKQRSAVSGADYWHSAQSGYSVAITNKMALVAINAADPFSAAPGTVVPEGFTAFREGSILACWLSSPGSAINQKLGEMGIPIELPAEQLFISLFPGDDRHYEARLQIQVENASQARALAAMFVLVRNFIPPQAGTNNPASLMSSILFANPPEQDGKNLNITTAPLSAQEIALLLKMFAIE